MFDSIRIQTMQRIGLDVDRVVMPETREQVYVARAERTLQEVVNIANIHVQGCCLRAVNRQRNLRNIGAESSEGILNFGRVVYLTDYVISNLLQPGEVVAAIGQFDLHLETIGCAKTLNGRWNQQTRASLL